MTRLLLLVSSLAISGCLNTVQERWCDAQRPCSAGFVCTTDGHCVLAADAGRGGGTGGASGGGVGGGSGGGGGGGGVGGGMPIGGGPSGGGGGGIPIGGGAPIGGGIPIGGGGGPIGGGGGMTCGPMSCGSGCCVGGRCVPTTLQNNSACGFFGDQCRACGLDEGCVGGKCIPVVNFDAGVAMMVGAPCRTDTDCGFDGSWFCIPESSGGQPTGFTGGYCSRMCDMAPCPNGTCIQAETGEGNIIDICLAACMTSTDCRVAYTCDQNVCLP